MIRRIHSIDDVSIEQLDRLGKMFVSEAKIDVEFDVEHFKKKFAMAMGVGVAAMWVMGDENNVSGLIGGIATDYFFSKTLCGIEAFWYVEPESRGTLDGIRLVNAFYAWAREEMGVKFFHMAHMQGIHPEKMRQWYLDQGFVEFETIYRRKV